MEEPTASRQASNATAHDVDTPANHLNRWLADNLLAARTSVFVAIATMRRKTLRPRCLMTSPRPMTLHLYMHFGPVHHAAVNIITNCCIRKYRSSVPLLSRYPLSPIDVGVVPLDLCLTDISSNLPNPYSRRAEGL